MIYVSKQQLDQVEYLIQQSSLGNHVLFDPARLRGVFAETAPGSLTFDPEDAYAVEPLLERLIEQPTLAAKRAYLESMDTRTFERVVRTYFNIVENNLYENLEVRH